MSHFSVVVCVEHPDKLEAALAPFDENMDVEPYPDYEEGAPEDFWLYRSLKGAAAHYEAGTGIVPYQPDGLGWSTAWSKDTPEVQRQKQRGDMEIFRSLPNPVTWADLVKLHNERYSDDDEPLSLSEDGRAYTMSTRNPNSKWDYWRIGGRWGGYFRYREECRDQVIKPERGWDSPETITGDACDGGPKSALNFDALRDAKAAEARKEWAAFHTLVASTPEARPWPEFAEMVDKIEGYTIQQARQEYHSQPRVEALKGSDFQWHDDAIALFQKPERLYVEAERAQAVPGYALLTLDGRWMAPGQMGWFGCSSDDESSRIGYWEAANAYIDSLPDSAWLIAVDCHI